MLRRRLFLTILCALGFIALVIRSEKVWQLGSAGRLKGPSWNSIDSKDSEAVQPSGASARNSDAIGLEEHEKVASRQQDLKDRLNALQKYGALGYAGLVLQPGEPSEFRAQSVAALKMVRMDHHVLAGALWYGEDTGSLPSPSGVRRSLDFKALEAISKSSVEKNGNGPGRPRSSIHRRPIGAPPRVFSEQKGLLELPLTGPFELFPVGKVSPNTENILHSGGLFVRAPQGEPVRSIFQGTVIFAEWLKEYGRVMIIDHGEHYCSLIAHADQLLKRVNDAVERGEVVATVGKTGALRVPGLYFEIRHHGTPVDPLVWLRTDTTPRE